MGNRWERAFRFLALDRMQARLHRWRLDLRTGLVTEEPLSDSITEFGMMNGAYAGGKYRYAYAATGKPAWFLFDGLVKHDLQTGTEERYCVRRQRLRQRDRDGATGREQPARTTATS